MQNLHWVDVKFKVTQHNDQGKWETMPTHKLITRTRDFSSQAWSVHLSLYQGFQIDSWKLNSSFFFPFFSFFLAKLLAFGDKKKSHATYTNEFCEKNASK
jgi:hypothetical protein